MNQTKKVLNSQGFVELIDVMGDDYSVVNAARVSYGGDSPSALRRRTTSYSGTS